MGNLTKWISRFCKNEDGNIIFLGAAAAMMLVSGTFLAVDHGINLTNQSDLEAKLTACTKYPAKEWAWYRVRQEAGVAGGASNSNLIIPDPGISQAAAKTALASFVQRCINDGTGTDFSNVTISGPEIIPDGSAPDGLIRFTANIPQVKSVGGSGSAMTVGAVSVTRLPFYDTDRADVVASAVMSLDQRSKTQLNTNLANVMSTFTSVTQVLGITGTDDIHFGLERGNIPVDSPNTGLASRHPDNDNPSIGWSGGMYDNAVAVAEIDFVKEDHKAWEHRFWPFEAQFLAKDVRRCAGNPVWTYIVGAPHGTPETEKVFVSEFKESKIGACAGTYIESDKKEPCGCDEIESSGSCLKWCDCGGGNMGHCCKSSNTPHPERRCCKGERVSDHIVDGHWMIACPRRKGTTEGFQLVPAGDFVSLEARLVKNLDGTPVPPGQQISLYADPTPMATANSSYLQTDEMLSLKKKNSDRMMLYGCWITDKGTPYDPGPPFGDPSHMGLNGLPDARGSWPLVNWNGTDSTPQGTFEAGHRDSACNLPSHSNTIRAYRAEFYPDGRNKNNCAPGNPMGQGCAIPEGKYQIFVHVGPWSRFPSKQRLRERRDTAWMDRAGIGTKANPDGLPPYGAGMQVHGWVTSGEDQNCGYGSGDPAHNGYHFATNCGVKPPNDPPKAKYVNKYYKHDNFYIPEEYLEIANIAVETGRNGAGNATLENIFDFDNVAKASGNPRPSWNVYKGMSPNPLDCAPSTTWNATGGGYPDFCKSSEIGRTYKIFDDHTDRTVNLQENAYWTRYPNSNRGVFRAYGTSELNPDGYPWAIGQPIVNRTGGGHFAPTNMGDQTMDVCTLATVKDNSSNCYPPENIPIGKNKFSEVTSVVASGYAPYKIHKGHGGNQGALLKMGARKLEEYIDSEFSASEKNGVYKTLIYIGSCPASDSFSSDDLRFLGNSVPWFANGNYDGSNIPGEVTAAMGISNTRHPGYALRQQTKAAFDAVDTRVGGIMMMTDQSCMPDFNFSDSATPCEGFCAPGYTPPGWDRPMTEADCAAELVCKLILESSTYAEVGVK